MVAYLGVRVVEQNVFGILMELFGEKFIKKEKSQGFGLNLQVF